MINVYESDNSTGGKIYSAEGQVDVFDFVNSCKKQFTVNIDPLSVKCIYTKTIREKQDSGKRPLYRNKTIRCRGSDPGAKELTIGFPKKP